MAAWLAINILCIHSRMPGFDNSIIPGEGSKYTEAQHSLTEERKPPSKPSADIISPQHTRRARTTQTHSDWEERFSITDISPESPVVADEDIRTIIQQRA